MARAWLLAVILGAGGCASLIPGNDAAYPDWYDEAALDSAYPGYATALDVPPEDEALETRRDVRRYVRGFERRADAVNRLSLSMTEDPRADFAAPFAVEAGFVDEASERAQAYKADDNPAFAVPASDDR
ncbi:MAG: hypothetical protein ACFB2Z_12375 [Maricaulaceae bacterium]